MDALPTTLWEQLVVSPPLTFLVALLLAALLSSAGRLLAGPGHATTAKQETYASGEAGPRAATTPGYEPYFMTAIAFTVLHLGVLVVAMGAPPALTLLYLGGLGAALAILLG